MGLATERGRVDDVPKVPGWAWIIEVRAFQNPEDGPIYCGLWLVNADQDEFLVLIAGAALSLVEVGAAVFSDGSTLLAYHLRWKIYATVKDPVVKGENC